MTPLDPGKTREAFALIRKHSHPLVHELVDTLEKLLLLDESMLALQARLEDIYADISGVRADDVADEIAGIGEPGDVIPFPGFSLRVV